MHIFHITVKCSQQNLPWNCHQVFKKYNLSPNITNRKTKGPSLTGGLCIRDMYKQISHAQFWINSLPTYLHKHLLYLTEQFTHLTTKLLKYGQKILVYSLTLSLISLWLWYPALDSVTCTGPNFIIKDLPSVLILIIADQTLNDSLCCS